MATNDSSSDSAAPAPDPKAGKSKTFTEVELNQAVDDERQKGARAHADLEAKRVDDLKKAGDLNNNLRKEVASITEQKKKWKGVAIFACVLSLLFGYSWWETSMANEQLKTKLQNLVQQPPVTPPAAPVPTPTPSAPVGTATVPPVTQAPVPAPVAPAPQAPAAASAPAAPVNENHFDFRVIIGGDGTPVVTTPGTAPTRRRQPTTPPATGGTPPATPPATGGTPPANMPPGGFPCRVDIVGDDGVKRVAADFRSEDDVKNPYVKKDGKISVVAPHGDGPKCRALTNRFKTENPQYRYE
ncbi:MAG: hypothetical protein KBC21_00615 [Candidatus Pacebacteria bacterium]|nr:hypothetical protein [Candidatus Paceibacterota bacterium]